MDLKLRLFSSHNLSDFDNFKKDTFCRFYFITNSFIFIFAYYSQDENVSLKHFDIL